MKNNSTIKPIILENIGNGNYRYNYNIKEIEFDDIVFINDVETIEKQIRWEYDSVIIYLPINKDKITRAVIINTWNSDYENKLINDYNEISLGNLTEEEIDKRTNKYIAFLQERKRLKEMIDNDWETIKDIIKS